MSVSETASATSTARREVLGLRASRIREVANAGIGREDVLAFWFGEPDEVTPAFVREEAARALAAGDTFYTHNLGLAPLREAIAAYVGRLHRATPVDAVAVTSSGMSALALVQQALLSPGDRVVAVTPLWPNLVEGPKILGARVHCVPLDFDARAGWRLDLDRLLEAVTPDTRMVIVNSPNNPTGWTIDRDAQRALLGRCRAAGTWLVADDAYERLWFGSTEAAATRVRSGAAVARAPAAPSFLELADPHERVISTNTFSKAWCMTGWRLGWIVAPPALVPELGKLIEYNTSCAPGFVQRAALAAVVGGEDFVAHLRARLAAARDLLCERLAALPGVTAPRPPGAMYAFFRVEGVDDSLDFCKRLVAGAGLGLAPGAAFGPEGEGFVRWCFAAGAERIEEGVRRLRAFLLSRA